VQQALIFVYVRVDLLMRYEPTRLKGRMKPEDLLLITGDEQIIRPPLATFCEQQSHDSIQFSLFCIATYHKLQIWLSGLYSLYTYGISVPGPHIGSGETPEKKKKKKLSQGKKGKKRPGEQQRRIPLEDGRMQ